MTGVTPVTALGAWGFGTLVTQAPSTDTSDFVYNLGALGIALVCIYYLLGRGDRREREAALTASEERKVLMQELKETREALINALKEHRI